MRTNIICAEVCLNPIYLTIFFYSKTDTLRLCSSPLTKKIRKISHFCNCQICSLLSLFLMSVLTVWFSLELKRSLVSSWHSSMRRNSVEGKLWLQRRQCVLEIMLDVFYCSGLIFCTLLHGYILFETNLCLRKVRVSTDNTFNFSRQGWEEIKIKMCFFT